MEREFDNFSPNLIFHILSSDMNKQKVTDGRDTYLGLDVELSSIRLVLANVGGGKVQLGQHLRGNIRNNIFDLDKSSH
jgi:hypothetical protein